jgi:flavodoxin
VLIVYCSRFGATEEIADMISKEIEIEGIKTDLVNLRDLKEKIGQTSLNIRDY